jgi:hypothetical protein
MTPAYEQKGSQSTVLHLRWANSAPIGQDCRGKPGAWKAARLSTRPEQLVRVGKGAQEQFLEYAHYLPERSVQSAVDRQKLAGFAALESTELAQDMDAERACLSLPKPAPLWSKGFRAKLATIHLSALCLSETVSQNKRIIRGMSWGLHATK